LPGLSFKSSFVIDRQPANLFCSDKSNSEIVNISEKEQIIKERFIPYDFKVLNKFRNSRPLFINIFIVIYISKYKKDMFIILKPLHNS
jgi:hypothetical protein